MEVNAEGRNRVKTRANPAFWSDATTAHPGRYGALAGVLRGSARDIAWH